jgi:hypothetical protein
LNNHEIASSSNRAQGSNEMSSQSIIPQKLALLLFVTFVVFRKLCVHRAKKNQFTVFDILAFDEFHKLRRRAQSLQKVVYTINHELASSMFIHFVAVHMALIRRVPLITTNHVNHWS